MFKKVLSFALAVLITMSIAVVGASALDTDTANTGSGDSNVIYFDYGSTWNNVSQIYAHIWIIGGDSFYGWQAGGEKCDRVSNTTWSYDLSKLEQSIYISGGLKSGTDYAVIFSADNGLQTFDTTFGTACIGDTAYLTGEQIENSVDPEKKAYEAVWTDNSKKYGPHLAISSIGNIVGSKLAPHEKGTQVIGDWLYAYYDSQTVDPVATVAKALPKFKVEDTDKIYKYIKDKDSLDSSNLSVIKDILKQAEAKAYGQLTLLKKSTTIYIGDKVNVPYIVDSKSKKVTFKSSNKKVATVSKKGRVTAKKAGTATITLKYLKRTLTYTIKVKKPSISIIKKKTIPFPAKVTMMYIKNPSGGKVSWSSSNPKVATVSSKGKVKSVSAGTTIITAKLKYKGKTYKSKCKLTVKKICSLEELISYIYDN